MFDRAMRLDEAEMRIKAQILGHCGIGEEPQRREFQPPGLGNGVAEHRAA